MRKILACTSLLALMSLTPLVAQAADEAAATHKGISKESSEKAMNPASGAAQQTPSPPSSGSSKAPNHSEAQTPSSGSADSSTGTAEQSSAPPSSSAADQSKPNPTSNSTE